MMLSEFWSELRFRLRALFARKAMETELDAELRFHIDREVEKYVAAGMDRAEAHRRATVAFGGLDRIKDDTRDARGVVLLEQLSQDTRYAIRGLRARAVFSAVVIATIALGVGVNAAMFGILDRTLIRPPAFMIDAANVHRIYVGWNNPDGIRAIERSIEYPGYQDFRRWSRQATAFAAFANRSMAVGDAGETQELPVQVVTAEFFEFFSTSPLIGRFFARDEDAGANGQHVAVLSYAYWRSHFGGRSDAIGAKITIQRETYRVIGVARPGFDGVSDQRAPAAFIPLTVFANSVDAGYSRDYGWSWLGVLARARDGVSQQDFDADLTNAYRLSWNAQREIGQGLRPIDVAKPAVIAAPVQLGRGPMAGPESKTLAWLSGVAFAVLVIACANVANLLLARGLRRRREIAVRRALGGSRSRLAKQLLTETLVLCAIGSVAGLLGAQLAAGTLQRALTGSTDALPLVTDTRTLVFALVVTVIAALLAGLLPAVQIGREDLAGSLKAGVREGAYRRSRTRSGLLVFQTSLSVVLLIGAGLFVRSLNSVRSIRLGYDVDSLVYLEMNARDVKLSLAEGHALASRLESEARLVPGVSNASLIVSVPFLSTEGRGLYVPGVDSVRKLGRFTLQSGSPSYFATAGTRIVRGRGFTNADRAGAPLVTVVSEAMAKALWKTDEPIGKCFRISSDTMPCTTVIGVAENMKTRQLTGSAEFTYYLPMEQYNVTLGRPPILAMFVRVRGNPDDFAERVRARLQPLLPGAAYLKTMPMHELIDPGLRAWTSGARMFLVFGTLALTLAAIGLYAVIAFSVAQRTPELGIRIALGARSNDVLRLVVREAMRVTMLGVAIGLAVAWMAGRPLKPLLYKISEHDPLVFVAVAAVLAAVAVLASAIPAARASRVDPNVALRAE